MLDGSARLHRGDGADISNFLFVSTWAEYTVVPQASVVAVPDYLPLERLCLLGCGFTTGFGAATIDRMVAMPEGAGSSMLFDRLAGRALEHDALYGAAARAGHRHGIPTPTTDAVGALLAAVSEALGGREAPQARA